MPCYPAETYSDPLVNPRVSFQQYLLSVLSNIFYVLSSGIYPFALGNFKLVSPPAIALSLSNFTLQLLHFFLWSVLFPSSSSVLLYRLHLQLKPDLTVGGRLRLHVG